MSAAFASFHAPIAAVLVPKGRALVAAPLFERGPKVQLKSEGKRGRPLKAGELVIVEPAGLARGKERGRQVTAPVARITRRVGTADNARDADLGSLTPVRTGGHILIAGKSGTGYVLAAGRLGGVGGQVSSATVCPAYGATATDGTGAVAHPFTVFTAEDGSRAVCVANYGDTPVTWRVAVEGSAGPYRVRSVDDAAWSETDGEVTLAPRSAAVVVAG